MSEQLIQTVMDGEASEIPLPVVKEYTKHLDKEKLIKEQHDDETLANIRSLAKEGERGNSWKDSVLTYKLESETGEELERIVIPAVCRKQVLKLAYSNKISGHFSHKKTVAALKWQFT